MKILAVIGSNRKGNTYHAIQQIENAMQKYGETIFTYLFLKDTDLNRCKGCALCIIHGEDKCPLMDERKHIEQMMTEADAIIFASPNYVCNVSSLMKNFIDRFSYLGHRPKFFGKPAMTVCTSCGPGGMKECLKSLSILSTGGFHIVTKLGLMTPYFKTSEWKKGVIISI